MRKGILREFKGILEPKSSHLLQIPAFCQLLRGESGLDIENLGSDRTDFLLQRRTSPTRKLFYTDTQLKTHMAEPVAVLARSDCMDREERP